MKRNDLVRCLVLLAAVATALLPARAARAATCAELNGTSIPKEAIGLPTTGATVTTTAVTPPAGDYCRADVAIHPVDPSAPDILTRVNLPSSWNSKALMQGGGGYDGSIPNTTVNFTNGPLASTPSPLAQGYATFSSNSGHVGNGLGSQDASFGGNSEALHNFAGDALKKTRDAAVYLIVKRYGSAPRRSYFVGGSSGGREALWVVQNTPKDFDGAVAMYPAWNAASLDLQFGRITRALAKPGAYPNPAKQLVWVNAIINACDALDGLVDGLVSNVAACHFKPETVRCPGGADTGDTCLSDAQIASIRVYGTPLFIPYRTGSGEFFYPGFSVFVGADLTGSLDLKSQQPTHELMTSDNTAAAGTVPRPGIGSARPAGREQDRPVRVPEAGRQAAPHARPRRRTGRDRGDDGVLRQGHRGHGGAQGAQFRALLHHPGSGTRPREPKRSGRRVLRLLGSVARPGRLGRERPAAVGPRHLRSECRDEGAHPPGLRVAVLAEVQRRRRSQQRRELHMRALRRRR